MKLNHHQRTVENEKQQANINEMLYF